MDRQRCKLEIAVRERSEERSKRRRRSKTSTGERETAVERIRTRRERGFLICFLLLLGPSEHARQISKPQQPKWAVAKPPMEETEESFFESSSRIIFYFSIFCLTIFTTSSFICLLLLSNNNSFWFSIHSILFLSLHFHFFSLLFLLILFRTSDANDGPERKHAPCANSFPRTSSTTTYGRLKDEISIPLERTKKNR